MFHHGEIPGDQDRVRSDLAASISGVQRGQAAARQLCRSLVRLLDVDGAALVMSVPAEVISSAIGASDPLPHELIELQYTLGEGPCLQSVTTAKSVMAADLRSSEAAHWPAFAEAASQLGVGAVFALPVAPAGFAIGALFLHRTRPGPLTGANLTGAYFTADLAALPILDLLAMDQAIKDNEPSNAFSELTTLTRTEVHQATGVLIDQLDVTPAEALVRLRGYAFAQDKTISEAAYDILDHRVRLSNDRTGTNGTEGDN